MQNFLKHQENSALQSFFILWGPFSSGEWICARQGILSSQGASDTTSKYMTGMPLKMY